MSTQYDIAIVGGGIVGITLALLVHQYRPTARVCLIDSSPTSNARGETNSNIQQNLPLSGGFDTRSIALSPSSMRIFSNLKLWDTLQTNSTAIRRVHVTDQGMPGHLVFEEEESLGFVAESVWLGNVLTNALESVKEVDFIRSQAVSDIRFTSSGATLQLAQEGGARGLQAQLAIIADGGRSPLRKRLGIHVKVFDYHQAAIVANVKTEKPHEGTAYERFTSDGPLALLPLSLPSGGAKGTWSSLVWTRPQDKLEATLAWSEEEFLIQLQKAFGYRLGKFFSVSERFHYPLKLQLADEQVRSSLVIVGNAAHYLHPVAGQGVNLALRDCVALCEVLKTARGSLGDFELLQKYRDRQYWDQKLTTELSHHFNRTFSSKNRVLKAGRTLGLSVLNGQNFMKSLLVEQLQGLRYDSFRRNFA